MGITWLNSSAPKAHRVPLELDFIIAAVLALAVFYFVKRAIIKLFPEVDEQAQNIITIIPAIGVFALVLYLFNL